MRTNKLAPVQIMVITTSITLGVKILTIQYDLVMAAEQDAWISAALGGLLTIIMGMFVSFPLAMLFSDDDLPDINIKIFGGILGRILFFPTAIYILMDTGLTVRIFVESLKNFLLDRTPAYVLIILFVISVVSIAKRGISTMAGSVDFMFPVFIIPIIILVFLPAGRLDAGNLLPVLYRNTPNVFKGAVPVYASMMGYQSILFFLRYCSDKAAAKKPYLYGLLLSVFIYITLTATTIMVFGVDEIKTMVYPTLDLSKSIEFPLSLFERFESLMITIWIPGIFAWLIIIIYASSRNFTVLFNLKPQYREYVVYAHIPVLTAIALTPQNSIDMMRMSNLTQYTGAALGAFFIPLVAVIGYIRKKRGRIK